MAAAQAEHVLHAGFFLLYGRRVIARVYSLWDEGGHCKSKGMAAFRGEAKRSRWF
ncbi:hypothetical protein HAP47_0036325 [Bradyrhizobium sp. 41S5]|uniref:hypothetical protein n=1 Tax=Bradyrhizobium sp. 41S5 TaxID=1404443 RepID=UPI00156B081C|nr:hypothetical protein [Bradyrhizobium sp. 41S5]UFX44270.1 hypothetical protein HAP47_0035085 [Bradyrhizobium sp. 41S5]UFX44418.1 hypothetical protein HAP47_0036325 [Bradyrhizobium sp. 41S5]